MEVVSRVEDKQLSIYARDSIAMALERFDGKEVSIHIKEFKKGRTGAQNRTLWNCYGPLSDHTGYTEEELHEIFKAAFIGFDVFTLNGREYIKPKTSTRLTVKGLAKMLEKVIFTADWLGVVLPLPEDNLSRY